MAAKRLRASAAAAAAAVLLCLAAAHSAAAQGPSPETEGGDIELYLYAEYTRGLAVPAELPTLGAYNVLGKRVDCHQARAAALTGMGGAVGVAAAVAAPEAPGAPAKCSGAAPLKGGLYTLQASYVEGANWPTWACYKNAAGASITAEAAAAPAAVPLYSAQAVELTGGASYACVATYTAMTAAQAAAVAAIDWDSEVAVASSPAAVAAEAQGCPSPGYRQPPAGRPPAALDIQGATIVNSATRKPVQIRGINWFGFNVPMGMVDGLWAGGSEATTDFSTIVYQLRMLGYNAVRLPFAHSFLAKTDVWDLERECPAVTPAQLKQRLTKPGDQASASSRILPANNAGMPTNGRCNGYLPTRNNMDRLMFTVQQFIANGIYVILDYQPQGLEQQPYNLAQFVSGWLNVWGKVACLPNFESDIAGRVLIDIMNEPDSMGIRWEASGDRPGAEQLYLGAADALWNLSPGKMLFMFEGTGQNMIGLNWGNGFVTDQQLINSRGLSNPTNFFNQLVRKPYVKKAVISPHLYPPSITMSTWLGEDLWKQSQVAFSYLQSPGYCTGGSCTQLPVLVGETGSAYHTDSDKQWLQDFADFAFARGRAAAYNSQPLNGWLWWAYNENSGDTGGIVMNQWQDLNWDKLGFMMARMDLQPWYTWPSTESTRPRRPRHPPRPGNNNNGRNDHARADRIGGGGGDRRTGDRRGNAGADSTRGNHGRRP